MLTTRPPTIEVETDSYQPVIEPGQTPIKTCLFRATSLVPESYGEAKERLPEDEFMRVLIYGCSIGAEAYTYAVESNMQSRQLGSLAIKGVDNYLPVLEVARRGLLALPWTSNPEEDTLEVGSLLEAYGFKVSPLQTRQFYMPDGTDSPNYFIQNRITIDTAPVRAGHQIDFAYHDALHEGFPEHEEYDLLSICNVFYHLTLDAPMRATRILERLLPLTVDNTIINFGANRIPLNKKAPYLLWLASAENMLANAGFRAIYAGRYDEPVMFAKD